MVATKYDFWLGKCKSMLSVTCWTAALESYDSLLLLGHSMWALKIKGKINYTLPTTPLGLRCDK